MLLWLPIYFTSTNLLHPESVSTLAPAVASALRLRAGRQLWLATLAGFGLSLTIECLQLLLHVGFFELTDLVMNTVGAVVGGGSECGGEVFVEPNLEIIEK